MWPDFRWKCLYMKKNCNTLKDFKCKNILWLCASVCENAFRQEVIHTGEKSGLLLNTLDLIFKSKCQKSQSCFCLNLTLNQSYWMCFFIQKGPSYHCVLWNSSSGGILWRKAFGRKFLPARSLTNDCIVAQVYEKDIDVIYSTSFF